MCYCRVYLFDSKIVIFDKRHVIAQKWGENNNKKNKVTDKTTSSKRERDPSFMEE
jgi:hypothetical protein